MLNSIKVGSIITYFDGHKNDDDIIITRVDGLDGGKATINTFNNSFSAGSRYSSSKVNERNIVIYTIFPPSSDVQMARQRQYNSCPVGTLVNVEVNTSDGVRTISGYVESNITDTFKSLVTGQISIICPEPYFAKLGNSGAIFYEYAQTPEQYQIQPRSYDGNAAGGYTLHLITKGKGDYVTGGDMVVKLIKSSGRSDIMRLSVPTKIPDFTSIASQVYSINQLAAYSINTYAPNGLVTENASDPWDSYNYFSDSAGVDWGQIVPGTSATGPCGSVLVVFDKIPIFSGSPSYLIDFHFKGSDTAYKQLVFSEGETNSFIKYKVSDAREDIAFTRGTSTEAWNNDNDNLRYLYITGGSDAAEFLNAIKSCATVYGSLTPSAPSLLKVKYGNTVLKRRWNIVMNPLLTSFDEEGNFTSNGQQYVRMKCVTTGTTSGSITKLFYVTADRTETEVYSKTTGQEGQWVNQRYRLVITDNQNPLGLRLLLENSAFALTNQVYTAEYGILLPGDRITMKSLLSWHLKDGTGDNSLALQWFSPYAFDGGTSIILQPGKPIDITVKDNTLQITSDGRFLTPFNKVYGEIPKISSLNDIFEITTASLQFAAPALEYRVLHTGGS